MNSEVVAGLAVVGGGGPPHHQPLSDLEKSSARKVRKEAEKQRKQAKKYEEQLKKIRGPKSQKIQIIDESFLEKYNHAQTLPPGPSLKTKKRSKKTPSEMVQLNLSDCLRDRLSLAEKGELAPGGELKTVLKPVVPIAITQPIVFHKGKQREVPKEKRLTKLKKDILNNRKTTKPDQEGTATESSSSSPTAAASQSVAEEVVAAPPTVPPVANGPKPPGESPFLKAIERCCSAEEAAAAAAAASAGADILMPPPSVGSEEYRNGFPALNDTVAKSGDKEKGVQYSRAFRAYCDHLITDEVRSHAETLVTKLFQFQANAYGKNPIKAVSNKRYCVGFNEILKYLETRKLKLVLIAPDLEPNDSIDQLVERVKTICRQQMPRVPIVFGVKRRKLGFHLLKKVPVSCVGVLSYSGADDTVKRLLEITEQERANLRALNANSGH